MANLKVYFQDLIIELLVNRILFSIGVLLIGFFVISMASIGILLFGRNSTNLGVHHDAG